MATGNHDFHPKTPGYYGYYGWLRIDPAKNYGCKFLKIKHYYTYYTLFSIEVR